MIYYKLLIYTFSNSLIYNHKLVVPNLFGSHQCEMRYLWPHVNFNAVCFNHRVIFPSSGWFIWIFFRGQRRIICPQLYSEKARENTGLWSRDRFLSWINQLQDTFICPKSLSIEAHAMFSTVRHLWCMDSYDAYFTLTMWNMRARVGSHEQTVLFCFTVWPCALLTSFCAHQLTLHDFYTC